MYKQEFLSRLKDGLSGLPDKDIEERLTFYNEMIDDRIEDGLTEEDAVSELGNVDQIASQTISETPLAKLVKERIKPRRRMRAWEIVLLILGSPIWVPLMIVFFILVLVLYIVIWVLVVCLWIVEACFMVSSLACLAGGTVLIFLGNRSVGIIAICAGLVLAGLSIFMFFGCKAATKGAAKLTKKIARGIKSMFLRKEKTK